MCFEVGCAQPIAALGRLPACQRHELAQVAVAGARGGQQHELGAGPPTLWIVALAVAMTQLNLGAVDQPERTRRFVLLARLGERQVCAHRTGERTLVGEREPRVFERERALDQFLRMRRAAQEREVRQAVQLGVGRCHREDVSGGRHRVSRKQSVQEPAARGGEFAVDPQPLAARVAGDEVVAVHGACG